MKTRNFNEVLENVRATICGPGDEFNVEIGWLTVDQWWAVTITTNMGKPGEKSRAAGGYTPIEALLLALRRWTDPESPSA